MVIEWLNGDSLEIPEYYEYEEIGSVYLKFFALGLHEDEPKYLVPVANVKCIIF